jgi:hypothetical protein
MLRAFFQAIAAGMRKAFGFAFSLVMLPFRLFAPDPRPSTPLIDPVAIKQRMQGSAEPVEVVQSHVRDSVIAWSWLNGSIIDRSTRPFPTALSRTMQTWLAGLDYNQLELLKNSGVAGIFAHVSGKKLIASVPAFGKLPAVTVNYPQAPKATADIDVPQLVRRVA